MQEILSGIFHWAAFHEEIQQDVHSYYIAATAPALLIDPMLPPDGPRGPGGSIIPGLRSATPAR